MGVTFHFQYEDEGGIRTLCYLKDEQVLSRDGEFKIPELYETVAFNVGEEKKGFMIKSKRMHYEGGDLLVDFIVVDIPDKK